MMRNVGDCETIAGHMYRMSVMTFLLDGKNDLDRTKCMELGENDLAISMLTTKIFMQTIRLLVHSFGA